MRHLRILAKVCLIAIALVLLTIIIPYVYSRVDLLFWREEINGLIGHPLDDVLAIRGPRVGIDVVTDKKEIAAILRFFHPRTRIRPQGKVIVAYRHRFPGLWQAMVFLDGNDRVFAVQLGSLDTYALECRERNTRNK